MTKVCGFIDATDECSTGEHDCLSEDDCVDTVANFTCKSKTGYQSYRKQCSGNRYVSYFEHNNP